MIKIRISIHLHHIRIGSGHIIPIQVVNPKNSPIRQSCRSQRKRREAHGIGIRTRSVGAYRSHLPIVGRCALQRAYRFTCRRGIRGGRRSEVRIAIIQHVIGSCTSHVVPSQRRRRCCNTRSREAGRWVLRVGHHSSQNNKQDCLEKMFHNSDPLTSKNSYQLPRNLLGRMRMERNRESLAIFSSQLHSIRREGFLMKETKDLDYEISLRRVRDWR